MKAFLIHCPESFAWNDLSINRKKYIEDFIDVHDYASEQDDTIYSNAEIWELKIGDFFFYEILYWDDITINQKLPWINPQMLTRLADFLGKNPSLPCKKYLYDNHPNTLCAQIGCYLSNYQEHNIIYDKSSWHEKRIEYLSQPQNNYLIPWQNSIVLPNTNYANEYVETPTVVNVKCRNDRNKDTIREVTQEILRRNYYRYNQELSSMEQKVQKKKVIRDIYEIKRAGEWQYISVDMENGLLEFCNDQGEHQGAYDYEGNKLEPPKPDHSLKALITKRYKRPKS